MRRILLVGLLLASIVSGMAQGIREFSPDTALFVTELRQFTGNLLEAAEKLDFEGFVHLYDSLPYENRLEVIDISNQMIALRCRPRPHFITYQRVIIEFFGEDKLDKNYIEWLDGFRILLGSREATVGNINQFLSLSYSLLEENVLYQSNSIAWKLSGPDFEFDTRERMTILCQDVSIACYSGKDFIQITNANGSIDPMTLQFKGKGGRVNWERAGLPASEVFADLDTYRINLKTPGYTADSVRLYYPDLFGEVALGKIEDKVVLVKDIASATYPKFYSYRSDYRIIDYIPGVNYSGGISVEGSRLVGSGSSGQVSVIDFYSNDTLRVRARTNRVILSSSNISSMHTMVSVYFATDSIYHPDLQLSFNISKDLLRLNKTENFKSQGPYSNSYHNIDMSFDELSWDRAEPLIKLQALQGTSVGRASFESSTFFDYKFFMDLQGMDYEHPLAQLYTYSNMLGARDFGLLNYSDWIGYSEYQVRHLIIGLSRYGFLYYDDDTELVILRQKLFDYISAAMKQRDYDVMRFISRTEGEANAELDLRSCDLKITGIPIIFLSDSQDVRLIPNESSIIMKRNRSFEFDGVVDAGLFRFIGDEFYFNYDLFKINLQNIDSLQLSVRTGEYNQYGEPIIRMIDNAFENMTGELLIDEPFNKSGLMDYPQYPTFTSTEGAYVFFDDKHIQNGVYSRERFYFKMDPFTVDSLDNFNPKSIAPQGTFISADILPPMRIEMTLRENNSLGFITRTDTTGLPLYGGVGTLYEEIEMSSSGLQAYGSFDFLTSTTWSDNFLMHPDSMMARSQRYLIRENAGTEGVEFPYAEVEEVDLKLLPDKRTMEALKLEDLINVFNDSVYHDGNLLLASSGLTGDGAVALPEGKVESELIRYESRTFMADSAGVKVKMPEIGDYPILASDVSAFVDIDRQRGEFTARQDATLIEMPYNLYETHLDRMEWQMDKNEIELSQQKELPENTVDIGIDSLVCNGPVYLSTHPGQDSLHFTAPKATYDYSARKLRAREVPFIDVADAWIFPDTGAVEIAYQASMSLLEDASVLANKNNRRHLIYDADISVTGARDYKGSGYYDYLDAFGNMYQMKFNRIWVDTSIVSRATASVTEADSFRLSPFFGFKGDVLLSANADFFSFDGGTRLVHDCSMHKAWLRFTSEIDPTNVRIPVPEQMKNTDLNKIFAGSMITRDSTHIYSAFLSGRKDYFDAPLTMASGSLRYNQDIESYEISREEKLNDPTLPGNYLMLETKNCLLYGEGDINLTQDYGLVKLTSAGNAVHRIEKDEFEMRLVMGIDFPFSEEALQVMGNELDSLPDLEPVDLSDPHYILAMKDLLGVEMANDLERQLVLYGAYEEIPAEWKHTIFLNDIRLKWNQDTRSFRYQGKVGIGNIGHVQVNKKVDAYIDFVEKGSGDQFDIYLVADDKTWYYMAYTPGGLQVLSSNRTFNNIVFELKPNERRVKGGVGKPSFIYSLAANRRLELFLNRFLDMDFEEE